MDYENIGYLKNGNPRQQKAYSILTDYQLLTRLGAYTPIVVGTIPIHLDIENSDLDIICHFHDIEEYIHFIKEAFSSYKHFYIQTHIQKQEPSVVIKMEIEGLVIEIFGQNIPTKAQFAYRHMCIEHQLLCENDESFRLKIIDLKRQGYKTEPAFAMMLGLRGNPYEELLKYEKR
ncbi:diadenosine tetraphosphate hydrolase [Anditalea andensis]|uniref:Diadenosine tetraphosphate hydrolase n=1 Tax=Anditalea andensis TaxID=1048983 RepID=A0A074L4T0_9BACT|nr:diadenosine tetraphosphate hydrolase [Anditalea andensis]